MTLPLVLLVLATFAFGYVMVGPRQSPLSYARRRPGVEAPVSALTRTTERVTSLLDSAVRGKRASKSTGMLEDAGISMRPQDFTLFVIVAAVVAGAFGGLLFGPVGILLVAAAPVGARVLISARTKRRQDKFADQLDDSLQLMASSLRAGQSLLQALSSVASEGEEPTSIEFTRVINETRVGRDLSDALTEVSNRMGSQDFKWVTQAVEINREVGGNLADVLDGVSNTIRERNQVRRQVKALSAEGKLSAYVLMILPIGISGFLSFSNPEYIHKFVESPIGFILIGVAVLLFVVGGWWMSKVTKIKF